MKSRVHPTYKTHYRVGNWRVRALVSLRDVTLWLSPEARAAWIVPPSGRPGGQQRFPNDGAKFSNSLIEAWWRSLKHHWLFLHALDSVATVRRLVAFYSTNTIGCRQMQLPRPAA